MSELFRRIRNVEIEANNLLEPFRYYDFIGECKDGRFYQRCRLCNQIVLDKIESLLKHLKNNHDLTFNIPKILKGDDS